MGWAVMMPCTMTIRSTNSNSLNYTHWTNFSKLWMTSNMFVSFHWLSTNTWYSLFCCPQSKEKLCLKAGSALATLICFIYLLILHFIHFSLLQVTEALFFNAFILLALVTLIFCCLHYSTPFIYLFIYLFCISDRLIWSC